MLHYNRRHGPAYELCHRRLDHNFLQRERVDQLSRAVVCGDRSSKELSFRWTERAMAQTPVEGPRDDG